MGIVRNRLTAILVAVVMCVGLVGVIGSVDVNAAVKKPGKPVVTVTPIDYDSIKVSWKAVSNCSRYAVYQCTDDRAYKVVKSVNNKKGTKTYSVTINDLPFEDNYFKVKAINGTKYNWSSAKSCYPKLLKPEAMITNARPYWVTVAFAASNLRSEGATPDEFLIFRSTKKNSGYKLLCGCDGNTKYIQDFDVKQGKTYFYKVKYTKSTKVSPYSSIVAIKVPKQKVPKQ